MGGVKRMGKSRQRMSDLNACLNVDNGLIFLMNGCIY